MKHEKTIEQKKKTKRKKDKEKNTGIKNIMKEPERLRQNEM